MPLAWISFLFSIYLFVVTVFTLPTFPGEEARDEGKHRIVTRSSTRLCGRNLVNALQLVCQSNYASPGFKRNGGQLMQHFKRSKYENEGAPEWLQDISNEDYSNPEMWDFKTAYSFVGTPKKTDSEDKYYYRNIRGVHDECCRRQCSLTQLQQYCERDIKRRNAPSAETP